MLILRFLDTVNTDTEVQVVEVALAGPAQYFCQLPAANEEACLQDISQSETRRPILGVGPRFFFSQLKIGHKRTIIFKNGADWCQRARVENG